MLDKMLMVEVRRMIDWLVGGVLVDDWLVVEFYWMIGWLVVEVRWMIDWLVDGVLVDDWLVGWWWWR